VEAGAASEAPHPDPNQARHLAVLPRGLPRSAPFSYSGHYFRDRDVASLQPRGALPELRRHPPRDRYLDWTGAWIKAAAKALDPGGIAVPERRGEAHGSRGRPSMSRRRRGSTSSSRTRSTGSSRSRSTGRGRRRRRSHARPERRPLQADQQRPLRQRLPGVHLSTSRPAAGRRSIAARSA
jgi:hypothetical protein